MSALQVGNQHRYTGRGDAAARQVAHGRVHYNGCAVTQSRLAERPTPPSVITRRILHYVRGGWYELARGPRKNVIGKVADARRRPTLACFMNNMSIHSEGEEERWEMRGGPRARLYWARLLRFLAVRPSMR